MKDPLGPEAMRKRQIPFCVLRASRMRIAMSSSASLVKVHRGI